MKIDNDYLELPYTTKARLQADLKMDDNDFNEALSTLIAMGLVSMDKEGRIYDVETNFNIAATKWKNS